jgi:hypothetical protein
MQTRVCAREDRRQGQVGMREGREEGKGVPTKLILEF